MPKKPKKEAPRMCSRFHCDKRGDRYCCADCIERKRDRCRNPCLNDPSRCGLEDNQKQRDEQLFRQLIGSRGSLHEG